MQQTSAGLLMYRFEKGQLQVLLAHPGGPFFQKKDEGVWSIPKGEPGPDEPLQTTALREFQEEVGIQATGPYIELTPIKQKSGKTVHAWAFEGNCNPGECVSNTFTMEWPPKSGRRMEFPEMDRAEFFDLPTARKKINPAQAALIDQLEQMLTGAR